MSGRKISELAFRAASAAKHAAPALRTSEKINGVLQDILEQGRKLSTESELSETDDELWQRREDEREDEREDRKGNNGKITPL